MKILVGLAFLTVVYAIPQPELLSVPISEPSDELVQSESTAASEGNNQLDLASDAAALDPILSESTEQPNASGNIKDYKTYNKIILDKIINVFKNISEQIKKQIGKRSNSNGEGSKDEILVPTERVPDNSTNNPWEVQGDNHHDESDEGRESGLEGNTKPPQDDEGIPGNLDDDTKITNEGYYYRSSGAHPIDSDDSSEESRKNNEDNEGEDPGLESDKIVSENLDDDNTGRINTAGYGYGSFDDSEIVLNNDISNIGSNVSNDSSYENDGGNEDNQVEEPGLESDIEPPSNYDTVSENRDDGDDNEIRNIGPNVSNNSSEVSRKIDDENDDENDDEIAESKPIESDKISKVPIRFFNSIYDSRRDRLSKRLTLRPIGRFGRRRPSRPRRPSRRRPSRRRSSRRRPSRRRPSRRPFISFRI